MTPSDFYQLAPMLVLLLSAAAILILDLASRERRVRLYTVLGGAGVVLAALLVLPLRQYAYENSFRDMLAADALTVFLIPLFAAATLLTILFSDGVREVVRGRHAEYVALLLVMTVGLIAVVSATNLLVLYLSLELISITAYGLTAFDPHRPRSVEAGLKYAIFGAVASGIMLFGLSLLYGMTGELSYEGVAGALGAGGGGAATTALGFISVLFILAGLSYKIAAVPFHAWCPDAYEGAPTPFAAMMSVAPKAAGFAALVRLFFTAFGEAAGPGTFDAIDMVPWQAVLGVISVASMTFGNLAAITQTNLKRLLAYSSIAHAGYMLMGVVALSRDGVAAVMAYLVVYLIMNMGAFFVVLAVAEYTDSEEISVFSGLARRLPVVSACFAVFLLSLTGIPPFGGFVTKFYLFAAVLQREGSWYVILAIIGVLNSVVSLYYYARVLRAMYLTEPVDGIPEIHVSGARTGVLAFLALLTVGLGIYWNPLIEVASRVSDFL